MRRKPAQPDRAARYYWETTMTGSKAELLAAAGLTMAILSPTAKAETAEEASNLAVVQRAFDAWATGSGSPYDLLAEEATWTIVGNSLASKTYPSREAFLSEVIRPFVARMSAGLKPTIREIHADGQTIIILFDASGTANDGKPYINTYAWFLDFADGKIVKASAFFDSIAFNDLWTRVAPSP